MINKYHQCKENKLNENRILLMLLPYWTPLIPPQGIASLKKFLENYGYQVRTVDANVETFILKVYQAYFDVIKEFVPKNKRGNFYNIGHNVLENHLMAHINYTDEQEYRSLVQKIIYNTYFSFLGESHLNQLILIVDRFYQNLKKYLIELLKEERPEVFGLTVYSHTLAASLFAFRIVKEWCAEIKTVMGGGVFSDQLPIGSPDFNYFLKRTEGCIDKMIIGEGQNLFLKYLKGELLTEKRYYTLQDINGETIDLAKEELPDLSDCKMELYPYLGEVGSKSCPFDCSFCTGTVYFGKYRKKKVNQIISEMKRQYQSYGSQIFFMCDALLNPIISNLAQAFLESDVALYWDGYFRVDEQSADLNNTILWRQGGFYRARLGIESGSQHVLDLMDKGITVEQTKVTLANLAEAGIKTTAYIVIGHPGETEEDFQMTLDLIEEMKDDIYQVECNPFAYYYTGQPSSAAWEEKRISLYPESAREMLISQTWVVNEEPTHKVRYERVNRVVEFCNQLGIYNPYSISEIYEADKRWAKLHKNAVPSLVALEDRSVYIDECKHVQKLAKAKIKEIKKMEFSF